MRPESRKPDKTNFRLSSIQSRELGGALGWSGVAEGISEIAEISLLLSLAIQRKKGKNAWKNIWGVAVKLLDYDLKDLWQLRGFLTLRYLKVFERQLGLRGCR